MTPLKHAFSYAATASIVAMFGLSVPTAMAQTETDKKDVSDDKCADIQLVLVNGTFDTSAQEDSTHDHGFGSKIACQMRVFGTGVLGTRYCRVPGSWYRAEGYVGPGR